MRASSRVMKPEGRQKRKAQVRWRWESFERSASGAKRGRRGSVERWRRKLSDFERSSSAMPTHLDPRNPRALDETRPSTLLGRVSARRTARRAEEAAPPGTPRGALGARAGRGWRIPQRENHRESRAGRAPAESRWHRTSNVARYARCLPRSRGRLARKLAESRSRPSSRALRRTDFQSKFTRFAIQGTTNVAAAKYARFDPRARASPSVSGPSRIAPYERTLARQ